MINVALASAPGVLGDLLQSVIERDPDFRLSIRASEPIRLPELGADPVDAVIVCARGTPEAVPAARLLGRSGCRAVVVISGDGKDAVLFHPAGRERLGALSPGRLLDALRRAVRHADA